MITEPRAEELYPTATDLFRRPRQNARKPAAIRLLAGLLALGMAVILGSRLVAWMDRNL